MTASNTLVSPAFLSVPASVDTLGPEVADLCELAGFPPDPEQQVALDAIFAFKENRKVAARDAAIVAPRQNIKTGLFKQCALGWLFISDQRLIIWSAHEFSTAQEAHRDLSELIEGSDVLRKRVKAIHRGNGDEGIELTTGQRVRFKARTKTGGRGLSGDKIVLDEAFALQPSHMGSLVPTLSARPDPQLLYGSSAGLMDSQVLRSIRDRGRGGLDPSLFYVEWCDDLPGECVSDSCTHVYGSVGCRLDDEARWGRANTQLGRRIELDYVRAERRMLPPAEFARERMGDWDEPLSEGGAFDAEVWSSMSDPEAERSDRVTFGLACPPDRSWTAIVAAWYRPDGSVHVALAENRPGTGWVRDRVDALVEKWRAPIAVASSARGLVSSQVQVVEPSTAEQALAHNTFADRFSAGTLRHDDEVPLNRAVECAAWRPMGDTRVLDRRGGVDISPLDAAALAVHQLGELHNVSENIW